MNTNCAVYNYETLLETGCWRSGSKSAWTSDWQLNWIRYLYSPPYSASLCTRTIHFSWHFDEVFLWSGVWEQTVDLSSIVRVSWHTLRSLKYWPRVCSPGGVGECAVCRRRPWKLITRCLLQLLVESQAGGLVSRWWTKVSAKCMQTVDSVDVCVVKLCEMHGVAQDRRCWWGLGGDLE